MAQETSKKPAPNWGGRPKGRRNLTRAERERIVVKKMLGISNIAIAAEEGISRETVAKVLNREEYRTLLAGFRSRALQVVVPDALEYAHQQIKRGLNSKKGEEVPGAMTAAISVLEGTQVLVKRQQAELAIGQPEKVGPYGLDEYGDKTIEEKECLVKFDRWPTKEELAFRLETGGWPASMRREADAEDHRADR